ncbi:6-phosphofructokinase [Hippea maritima]|uniref:6-phosphofructokinase n=1 Tax=Hippea maritima (strain ATCC 700847 / DSM 10411 / MH2) TaxID=760142 RepID=F2LVI1_HIPMA|nr:6-phosphofructokinase [Hippea maritima]AEA33765.1 6-phosphofructokinase [Hippea maritima DSM 10411]
MRIGIFTSGGDAAGMNPALKAFVELTLEKGWEPFFVYNGLEGLIDGKIRKASYQDVAGILHKGGTIIKSSRSKRFYDYEYRKRAYDNLKKHDIEKIIVLGGDGSFRAMDVFFEEFGVSFAGIPVTIDNDIYGTDYCLGVDTALNVIRMLLDNIRDTASSFGRAFVVETMGRECGYLALVSSITSGAEICVIPELDVDFVSLKRRLSKELASGRGYVLAVVAEGSNKTQQVADFLKNDLGMETRITTLGHVQRGGNPTVFDRLMAYKFIEFALENLRENIHHMVGFKDEKFYLLPIKDVVSHKYKINDFLLKLGRRMTR